MKKNIFTISIIITLAIIGGIYLRQVDSTLITSFTIIPTAPADDFTIWYSYFFDTDKVLLILTAILVISISTLLFINKDKIIIAQYPYLFIFIATFVLLIYGNISSFQDTFLKITFTLINLIYFQSPLISALFYIPLICTIKRRNLN